MNVYILEKYLYFGTELYSAHKEHQDNDTHFVFLNLELTAHRVHWEQHGFKGQI